MAKPAGPMCNLRCTYCFYIEKSALFGQNKTVLMNNDVLEAYIKNNIQANIDNPEGALFAWQGGEPTLIGIDFYKRAIALEKKYSNGRPIKNTIQTNGILLNNEWCSFFAENSFLVGLSLDGPENVHDYYRRDINGKPTFKRVFESLKLLQKHNVEYNLLACVARETSKFPLETYKFFKENGIKFVQFIPIVERLPDGYSDELGLKLATPPDIDKKNTMTDITPWSVLPEDLGKFYIDIFNEWVRNDVGDIFIMNFEWCIYKWLGGDGPVCYLSKRCGDNVIVEQNGDVYSCDHYVYPDYFLGNLLTEDINNIVKSSKQQEWGARKEETISNVCKKCEVFSICSSGCPKHRFNKDLENGSGLNYLCLGFKKFYMYIRKYLETFKILINNDYPCDYIMKAFDKPLLIVQKNNHAKSVVIWLNENY